MEKYAVKIENITKVYPLYDKPIDRLKESLSPIRKIYHKQHYALRNVSFTVKRGEFLGILGANGAGKSTILKIITGVLTPTSGKIQVNGKISALLELGAGFNMEYTGIENIYLNGQMMGFSRTEVSNRLQDILDFADIGDFVYQPVKTYSSGMFVRLAFAVAINIDPEILIVDEALSVGDVFFQAKCYKKFEDFRRQGKTILFVSHSLSTISKYCDRVVLLNSGEKMAEGKPADMIDLFKKVLVNQVGTRVSLEDNTAVDTKKLSDPGTWKAQMRQNPNADSYGNGIAEIFDFCMVDDKGKISDKIQKGTVFTVKMAVRFRETVQDPIFAFTILDLQGTEITGTNTLCEQKGELSVNKGDVKEISFTQKMDLQGGEYMLNLGCTGFKEGAFTVYHRLYQICGITVISQKNTVGYYDMNSKVEIN